MSELHEKFGELLRLERQRRSVDLADVSAQLKITETNLTYIENGSLEELPDELYYNLFAKSYAEPASGPSKLKSRLPRGAAFQAPTVAAATERLLPAGTGTTRTTTGWL